MGLSPTPSFAGAFYLLEKRQPNLLACTLAVRNGFPDSEETYFPVWKSKAAFLAAPGRKTNPVLKKIKRLSQVDQGIIKDLRPYPGGDNLLFALHDLDLTRKHRRLLNTFVFPRGIGFEGFGGAAVNIGEWRGLNEKTVLAWTDASAPDGKVTIGLHIAFDEAGTMHGKNFAVTIRDFARLAMSIIATFDTP